ncbi:MAG TPA: hypothetical protein VGJ95_11875 [Pseudonocardiaceae bacterium]
MQLSPAPLLAHELIKIYRGRRVIDGVSLAAPVLDGHPAGAGRRAAGAARCGGLRRRP